MNNYIDVSCDLWIIREWLSENNWKGASDIQRKKILEERLGDEQAGYELPDDYSAGARLHIFGSDDCEVWLGCLNAAWLAPEDACRLIISSMSDREMAELIILDVPYVVRLDGSRVTGEWLVEQR